MKPSSGAVAERVVREGLRGLGVAFGRGALELLAVRLHRLGLLNLAAHEEDDERGDVPCTAPAKSTNTAPGQPNHAPASIDELRVAEAHAGPPAERLVDDDERQPHADEADGRAESESPARGRAGRASRGRRACRRS